MKLSGHYFYKNLNTWGDFQICISVPLSKQNSSSTSNEDWKKPFASELRRSRDSNCWMDIRRNSELKHSKSSCSQMFFKIGSLKNFAIFTEKYLCWGLFSTSGCCLWQSYHSTVRSAGVSVLWFRASTCFRFWWKTCTKRCTNNSLLSREKQFLSWLITCFRFQNMFWKNISCFRFWWETYTKSCTNICVTSSLKRLHLAFTWRLINCFQFQDMIWKTRQCCVNKNIKFQI